MKPATLRYQRTRLTNRTNHPKLFHGFNNHAREIITKKIRIAILKSMNYIAYALVINQYMGII